MENPYSGQIRSGNKSNVFEIYFKLISIFIKTKLLLKYCVYSTTATHKLKYLIFINFLAIHWNKYWCNRLTFITVITDITMIPQITIRTLKHEVD